MGKVKDLKFNFSFIKKIVNVFFSYLFFVEWNYHHPEQWKFFFSKDCDGSRQLPIDISEASGLKKMNSSLKLFWKYYDNIPESTIGAKMEQLSPHVPYIKFNDSEYIFEQLHFHWGRNNEEGSEHRVNGER